MVAPYFRFVFAITRKGTTSGLFNQEVFPLVQIPRNAVPNRILPASGGVLTFFVYEETHWRAVEWARLEF